MGTVIPRRIHGAGSSVGNGTMIPAAEVVIIVNRLSEE